MLEYILNFCDATVVCWSYSNHLFKNIILKHLRHLVMQIIFNSAIHTHTQNNFPFLVQIKWIFFDWTKTQFNINYQKLFKFIVTNQNCKANQISMQNKNKNKNNWLINVCKYYLIKTNKFNQIKKWVIIKNLKPYFCVFFNAFSLLWIPFLKNKKKLTIK